MITKNEIIKSVAKVLAPNFPAATVHAFNSNIDFKNNAFSIDIIDLVTMNEAEHYVRKSYMIDISYRMKNGDDIELYNDMTDIVLYELFTDNLRIESENGDRIPRITDKESNHVDDTLHMTFNISFMDTYNDYTNYSKMEEIKIKESEKW